LGFSLIHEADPEPVLRKLARKAIGDELVVGFGAPLVMALGADLPGLRGFPASSGPGFSVPSTQCALWCWARGEDRGHIMQAARELELLLEDAFDLEEVVDGFVHDGGRDLTGYVDGTENPTGDKALEAGIVQGEGTGLDGSSYVAVQQWNHDLQLFASFTRKEQDEAIGRRRKDDTEIDDAPDSAHVKRTAQENFDPEAFLVRRSMPFADGDGEGLVFVAFGRSLDAFEAQLRRMTGEEDGTVDALFRFTRPTTGSFYWCPPLRDGRLDLRALGLR
jgi:putative iron-dependent peroxidase